MLRVSIARSATVLSRRSYIAASRTIRPVLQYRCESTAAERTPAEQAKKEAKDRRNDMQHDWDAKEISYGELKPLTQSPVPDTYLIDVREPDETIQGMIPSAVNLPLTVLGDSLHLNSLAFLKKHGFEKPRKNQQLIFYCRSGKRSASASDVAKRNGFTNILNYKGSWLEWVKKENVQK